VSIHLARCLFTQRRIDSSDTIVRATNPNAPFTLNDEVVNEPRTSALLQQWTNQSPEENFVHLRNLVAARSTLTQAVLEPMEDEVDDARADFGVSNDYDDNADSSNIPTNAMVQDPNACVESLLEQDDFGTDLCDNGFSGFRSSAGLITLDPETAFQSHLLMEMMKFCSVPLKLYDSVMNTIKFWAIEKDLDFNRTEMYRS
jgi:hypothetical protein